MNRNQILAVVIAILGILTTSTAQLTELFGAGVAKDIISLAGLLNSMLSSILAVVTGQSSIVKDVAAMEGVEGIKVNAKANQTLAAIAVDPAQGKVEATAQDEAKVVQIAANGD